MQLTGGMEEAEPLDFYNPPELVPLILSEASHLFRHERSGRSLVTAASSAQITTLSYNTGSLILFVLYYY